MVIGDDRSGNDANKHQRKETIKKRTAVGEELQASAVLHTARSTKLNLDVVVTVSVEEEGGGTSLAPLPSAEATGDDASPLRYGKKKKKRKKKKKKKKEVCKRKCGDRGRGKWR